MKKPIYVGDTILDQRASLYNNIPYVYVSYGFGNVNKYTYKIDDFYDLKKICYNLKKKGN